MSFSLSSQNTCLKDGHTLHSTCKRKDGSWKDSSINLNNYITNDNGRLLFGGINFSLSCTNISILSGHILVCQARAVDGSWHENSLDLNLRIGNNDGNLCFN